MRAAPHLSRGTPATNQVSSWARAKPHQRRHEREIIYDVLIASARQFARRPPFLSMTYGAYSSRVPKNFARSFNWFCDGLGAKGVHRPPEFGDESLLTIVESRDGVAEREPGHVVVIQKRMTGEVNGKGKCQPPRATAELRETMKLHGLYHGRQK